MTDPPTQVGATVTNELFDKYLLPKIALAVILGASLIGVWLTGRLGGQSSIGVTLAKWVYLVSLGVLTGGLVWKHLFVRPRDLGTGASEYCAEMYSRFDRIAVGAVVVLAASAPVVLIGYLSMLGTRPLVIGLGAVFSLWLATTLATARRSAPVDEQFRSPAGLLAVVLAATVVVLTALAEVSLRGFEPAAAVVRTLHLLAFAAWLGGAVWNIFVAVPTGQRHPTTAVVRAAGDQLERFRWAVRVIIPTLLLTGAYQAVDVFGLAAETYLGSFAGAAVLAKVGFIGLLFVIFKACPMWRACSPIDGVCDLNGIGDGSPSGTSAQGDTDD